MYWVRKNKLFWFYNYCSTYTLKFFTKDIGDSSLLFTNTVLKDSPTYLCPTFVWPPSYQHITSDHLRNFLSDGLNTQLEQFSSNEQLICRNFRQRGNHWLWWGYMKVRRTYISESIRTTFVKRSGESQIIMVKNFNA